VVAAGAAATTALDRVLEAEPGLTGPLLARELAAGRGADPLVAGASNPIRDLDLAMPVSTAVGGPPADEFAVQPAVQANRGLSGIDGTVSTAIGLALGGGRVRALVGDLTFLHDAGALLLGPQERRPDLQVVVLNDGGGGIFSLLEHGQRAGTSAGRAAVFERVFGTPQQADLAALCQGYGVEHRRVNDLADLRKALADPPPGLSVLEVPAERSGLRDLHSRIRAAVHHAVRPVLGPP
jgi:2-succinyl-5-enolpyruvyl-6-hydroxy-3-cyclohexene-1-carboxylate synthase